MTIWSLLLFQLLPMQPADANVWQPLSQHGALSIWTRPSSTAGIHEVKAETILPVAPEKLFQVITDTEHYAEFMPYVEEAHRLAPIENGQSVEYQRISPPLIKQRDYVLKTQSQADHDRGIYSHRWQAIAEQGPPPRPDTVRLTTVHGQWLLHRIDTTHTHVTYQLLTDPGGQLPHWIANRANSQSIPKLIDAVRKRAEDPNFRS